MKVKLETFNILIPTFNPGPIFLRCLSSCLHQEYKQLLIFVSDDSTDDYVRSIISQLNDKRIIYIRNRPRLGAIKNWNSLLSASRPGYSKLLHQDEYFCNNSAVTDIVDVFNKKPTTELVINSHFVVDTDGNHIKTKNITASTLEEYIRDPLQLICANSIGSPSNVTMSSKRTFLYDLNLKWFVDVEAYMRECTLAKVEIISKPIIASVAYSPHQMSRYLEYDYCTQASEILYIIVKHHLYNKYSLNVQIRIVKALSRCPRLIPDYMKLLSLANLSGFISNLVVIVVAALTIGLIYFYKHFSIYISNKKP